MARVTIEDCLNKLPNRFALVHIGAQRVRQLYHGAPLLIKGRNNKEIVMALREIAAGKVIATEPLKALPEK
ncbi:MAG: DNA-directed RNA polymerase subunit omega [Desulfobacteraceae bacterium]